MPSVLWTNQTAKSRVLSKGARTQRGAQVRDASFAKQVPSTAPKIRVEEPGFFFTQNAQKAFIHIDILKVHDETWISLKSSEITMGCKRVARTLHADLCPVFLNKRGLGKPRLHALWRISHTANLFCLPGKGFPVVLRTSLWYNQIDKSGFVEENK